MSTSRGRNEQKYWPHSGGVRKSETWNWNVQPPPFRTPLEFHYRKIEILSASEYNPFNPDSNYEPAPFTFKLADNTDCINAAVEKFQDELGQASSWGTNLAEAGQSVSTVEKRCLQVAKAAREIRNFKFGAAARTLGIQKMPKGLKRETKQFANNFLEFHLGWQPAIADVHDAVQTMTKADFGTHKVKGSSSDHASWRTSNSDYRSSFHDTTSWNMEVKFGALVRITNESAYLANQMGLINPLSVAWDLVPFSFVVDWFANVGQCLGAITGHVGLEITNSYATGVSTGQYSWHYEFTDYDTSVSPPIPKSGYQAGSMKNVYVDRTPGYLAPRFHVKPFKGFSPFRGLTAASLLLQALK
jgi:hypothetical protein